MSAIRAFSSSREGIEFIGVLTSVSEPPEKSTLCVLEERMSAVEKSRGKSRFRRRNPVLDLTFDRHHT